MLNLLVLIGALVLAGLAGRTGSELRRRGFIELSALSVIALVAVLAAPDGGFLGIIPSVIGWIVAMLTLRALLRRMPMQAGDLSRADDLPTDRRRFLALTGLAGGGAVLAVAGTRVLPEAGSRAATSPTALQLPAPATPAPALPAGTDFKVPGCRPTSPPTPTSTGSTPPSWSHGSRSRTGS